MFIKPCQGYITSLYDNERKNPVTGKVQPHWGIDYGSTSDNTIVAAADGTVTLARANGGFGNCVYISHNIAGQIYETVYAHLSSISVKVEQTVKQGQMIGVKGSTGNSTGIHLHFEISTGRWNNQYTGNVNPAVYIDDPDVRRLQMMLNEIGYKVIVDGFYGDRTIKEVAAYQKANELTADGIAGGFTMAAVEKSVQAIVKSPEPILKPSEEETRMFRPSSATLKTAYEQFLSDAVNDGTIADKWLIDFKADKLSLDDALALKIIVDQRRG
ncbi:peptidoglycan DD-metalloendopeptidase family protein [Sporosarcina sp. ANT_H38]|uniref:peptidoglycan DD-metalloendopeptidase family protein n=1 Tax=Sporosarcina sp. ANT_H38 TaxID=2597358 RepID=UPI0011F3FD08|nr:peptidoglycan DD-metalloendopeptidase family protein [Sporosarcina sp. ANT_H38]KAA0966701.1 peptidoglycan DD-metalloendopeptidase family protein [Sporosarcina sp. ANT_H38]